MERQTVAYPRFTDSFGDFGGHHINYLPITDPNTAIGRVVENTLFDIKKQDPADHKTKVFVEIEKVNEGVATQFSRDMNTERSS